MADAEYDVDAQRKDFEQAKALLDAVVAEPDPAEKAKKINQLSVFFQSLGQERFSILLSWHPEGEENNTLRHMLDMLENAAAAGHLAPPPAEPEEPALTPPPPPSLDTGGLTAPYANRETAQRKTNTDVIEVSSPDDPVHDDEAPSDPALLFALGLIKEKFTNPQEVIIPQTDAMRIRTIEADDATTAHESAIKLLKANLGLDHLSDEDIKKLFYITPDATDAQKYTLHFLSKDLKGNAFKLNEPADWPHDDPSNEHPKESPEADQSLRADLYWMGQYYVSKKKPETHFADNLNNITLVDFGYVQLGNEMHRAMTTTFKNGNAESKLEITSKKLHLSDIDTEDARDDGIRKLVAASANKGWAKYTIGKRDADPSEPLSENEMRAALAFQQAGLVLDDQTTKRLKVGMDALDAAGQNNLKSWAAEFKGKYIAPTPVPAVTAPTAPPSPGDPGFIGPIPAPPAPAGP